MQPRNTSVGEQNAARLRIHPQHVRGRISPWLYGHFLEHILNSVDGGLHAELLTERRFRLAPQLEKEELEQLPRAVGLEIESGDWRAGGATLLQISYAEPARAWMNAAPAGQFSVRANIMRLRGHSGGGIVLERETGAQVCCNLNGFIVPPQVLERGTPDGGGVRATEPSVMEPKHSLAGLVEIGRWIEVRIEVRGRQLQWFIDGVLRHEVETGDGAWRRVGLECIKAQVAFAGVYMTDERGHVFGGMPAKDRPGPYERIPAFGWKGLEGSCRYARCGEDGRTFLRITPERGAAGVRQGPLAARAGVRLRGSLLARAPLAGAKLRVGMRECTTHEELTATELGGIKDTWQPLAFELTPGASCEQAEFFLRVESGGVEITDVSLLPAAAGWPPLRSDLLEAVRALRPSIIRWPGGCFTWVYDWKTAIGPRAERGVTPLFDWTATGGTESNDFGTDEFVALCRSVGAEPLLIINMNLGVKDALDWYEYCNGGTETVWGARRAANGHPETYNVRCWGIDNERWGFGAARYAQLSAEFVAAIRARQPDALIWLVGSNLEANLAFGKAVENHFGADVVQCLPTQADFLSLHGYWGRCAWERLAVANVRIEEYLQKEIAAYRAAGGGREKIAFDEWNPGTTDYQSGIAAALLLNTLERQCNTVGMASPALWLRHTRHGDAWDNALINFDHRGWYPSVTYLVNRLWSENRCPLLVQTELTAPMRMLDGIEAPVVDTVATADPESGRVVVKAVNRDTTLSVELIVEVGSAAYDGYATVTVLTHDKLDDHNTPEQPDKIRPQTKHVPVRAGQVAITLPPVSAVLIALRAARLQAD